MKTRLIIATIKSWNIRNAGSFIASNRSRYDIKLITDKRDLTIGQVKDFGPKLIFFPHWSWKIPEGIWRGFECVAFHMTDLPFGRGGSPLQNLISRGCKRTAISAFRVERSMDAGPVYLKTPLSLSGSAEEIYHRFSRTVFSTMLPRVLAGDLQPKPQSGLPVLFKRRTPEQSRIPLGLKAEKLYDFIRMLDAEGYPPALLEVCGYRMAFSKAHLSRGRVEAKVVFDVKERYA